MKYQHQIWENPMREMSEMKVFEKPTTKLLRASEVAEILSVSRAHVYHLMKQGSIRTVIIGGALRIRPVDLQSFIEENLEPPIPKSAQENR